MPTVDQLQTWLSEAMTARHALATGARTVEIRDQGSRLLKFSETTIDQLDAYIATLRAQLSAAMGKPRARTFRLFQSGTGN